MANKVLKVLFLSALWLIPVCAFSYAAPGSEWRARRFKYYRRNTTQIDVSKYGLNVGGEAKFIISRRSAEKILKSLDKNYEENFKEHDIWFFDTADQQLYDGGLVLRLRNKSGILESTVKLLGAPEMSYKDYKKDKDFKLEADTYFLENDEEYTSINASLNQKMDFCNEFKPKSCFIEEEFDFIKFYSPLQITDWSQLKTFGPVKAHVWEYDHKELGKITVEYWRTQKNKEIYEISGKVKNINALYGLKMKFIRYFKNNRIRLADQEPKIYTVITEK